MITNSSSPLVPRATLPPIHHHNNVSTLTEKEMKFLLKFFPSKVPCNLLVFGDEHEYSKITAMNVNGVTVFLQSNPSTRFTNNNTKVYKIAYNTVASEAYKLLKDARENEDCKRELTLPKGSKCNLGLSNLPREVYDTMWDVVIVDGPNGDTPDSPGRMSVIYTTSILARRGNKTHVLVHDVDRMIEKWYSREFLCEENLVYSKGRFWHFEIVGGVAKATKFCIA
ncbi:hypothetical protein RD792_011612 [Penstemon davidsonii]|uniref:Polysaccharide biosynthesis domain-containing protein n=1 Tax=Penstemon davidsonii TaxID=160366 RepID=A0ABR0CUL9_9LAMI|nr:hypothetical protein RD792_011612 [Penstemon davidsonii]